MATAPNQTAKPVGKPRAPEVMSRKDRLSLLFSLLALVISATTLVWNRVDKQREAVDKRATASYHAYQLGKRFATSFIMYTQVRKGDPKAVEAAKAEALEFASRTAQPAADQLELRMDVASIIKNYNPKGGIIGEGVIDSIETRMRGVNGAKVTGRFTLGFYLTWLYIESQIGATDHPQDMQRFKQGYPAFANTINEQLEALDMKQRLSKEMPSVEVLSRQIESLMTTVEAKLAANKG